MKLNSTDNFKQVKDEMYKMIQSIDADYNELVEIESEIKKEYYLYHKAFSDSINYTYHALTDVESVVYKITELDNADENEKEIFRIHYLEKELKNLHIRLKSLLDILIRWIVKTYRIPMDQNIINLKKIIKKLKKQNEIYIKLNELSKTINKFDDGKRNIIIHEGRFEDKEIEELHQYSMIGWITDKDKYELTLKKKIDDLLGKRIDLIDEVCEEFLSSLLEIINLLWDEYDRNEKLLA